MEEETVDPQNEAEIEDVPEVADVPEATQQESAKQVPLSALQKERRKRQELELEIQWERQRNQTQQQPAPVENDDKYETATREDLTRSQNEAVRIVEEKLWIKANPEKVEKINDYLPEFLKQRPNLAHAINSATNRYEEAYILMEALTPKQQQQLKTAAIKKDAPGAPSSVPKSASLNQTVDVMSMSDSEFTAWRNSQKRRR